MKIAYIMRGIPGSGKSTTAKNLVRDGGVIHSTDDFFSHNGVYRFDPTKLAHFHDQNFAAFCRSLQRGISIVVCDNTNYKRIHFKRYVKAARRAGYRVIIKTMPHPDPELAAQQNLHHVPLSTILRILAEWEP